LLEKNGRHSFVVALSMAFSKDFDVIRQLISDRASLEVWSSFAHRPDGLFTGPKGPNVKNVILVLGPGRREVFSSSHRVFSQASRAWLFENIEYLEIMRVGSNIPIRAGAATGLVEALMSIPNPTGKFSNSTIGVAPTALYWFPVLPILPPRFNADGSVFEKSSSRSKKIKLSDTENKLVVAGVLAGKLSFLTWHSTADNFDVAPKDTLIIRSLLAQSPDDSLLNEEVRELFGRVGDFVIQTLYAKKIVINFRWIEARGQTDKIDRRLLEANNLLKHWRNLNIWYRQVLPHNQETSGNSTPASNETLNELKALDLVPMKLPD
jgi:hypothetical protein